MYTSGTTGGPKGVLVTHRNVIRLVKNTNYIQLTGKTRILQTGAPVFDATTFEIWGSLLNGGQLLLTGKEVILVARQLGEILERFDINTLWLSAPLFNQLLDDDPGIFSTLDYLLVGGDVLSTTHINRVRRAFPGLIVINGYGPTENTTFSTTYPIREEFTGSIPIGKPIANSTAYVVDGNSHLQPIGVSGELLVGGDGVSSGYLNNPELTAEKFCLLRPGGTLSAKGDRRRLQVQVKEWKTSSETKPLLIGRVRRPPPAGPPRKNFSLNKVNKVPGKNPKNPRPIYHTGDLVRWRSDGNIEFLRRIDQQVKVRGFRIELGEIENQLLTHGKVKEAVVLARQDNNDKYLCAYIVAQSNDKNPIEPSGIREYLSNRLPDYMIPSYFVQLDHIPLTINGKVDRKALPEPEPGMKAGKNYIAPRNEIEKKLASIWSEILNLEKEKISMNDNFFHLGGHSLKVTMLAAKIHQAFQVKLPLADIFINPTIKEFAALISKTGKTTFADLEASEKKEFYALSYNQRRLWLLHQVESGSSTYNLPGRIELHHPLDEGMIKNTLYKMVERHESLRTGFKIVAAELVQYIVKTKEVKIPFKKIDIFPPGLEERQRQEKREQIYAQETGTPIDLDQVPLFRALLLKWSETDYDFIFNMHHIITDGWSIEVLKREFLHYYNGLSKGNGDEYQPQPVKLQYKDFAAWHNRQLAQPLQKEQSKRFWKDIFKDGVPVLQLPVKPGGSPGDPTGAAYQWIIDKDTKNQLKHLAQHNHTTLFTVMFSLYLMLLSRLSNQKDVICSIIAAGREHVSLRHVVGFFVNSILFKTHVDDEEGFTDFLLRVNTGVMEIFQHQAYPLELVFKELKMKYPDVPVSLNMLNIQDTAAHLQMEAFKSPQQHMENVQDVKFDIEVYISEYENGLLLYWAYKKSLYDPIDIEYIVGEYIKLVDFFKDNFQHSYAGYKNAKKKKKHLLDRKN